MSIEIRRNRVSLLIGASLLAIVAGCAGAESATSPNASAAQAGTNAAAMLFAPGRVLADHWEELAFGDSTEYTLVADDGRIALMAEGKGSSSGLVRRIAVDVAACPTLEWSWRVDRAQQGADISRKEREDVAAAIYLMFGNPGFLTMPDPVPTLRYVWTAGPQKGGVIIDSPYLPGTVRSIVIRDGAAPLGTWTTERRDLAADFKRAFPELDAARVHAMALYTDNDQTGEPVTAYYGDVRVSCRSS